MDHSSDSKTIAMHDGITQFGNNLRADAQAAIDKVPAATESLASTVHEDIDAVANTVDGTTERLIARGKQVGASCKALTESGRSRVRASPAMAVLLAAVAGYGISRLVSLSARRAK